MPADTTFDRRFRRPRTLVFGIGAAKCGTSWLNALLRSHPRIHVAHQRELHYWDVVRPPYNPRPAKFSRETLDRLERLPPWRRLVRAPALRYYRAAVRMREAPDARHNRYANVFFARYRGQPVAAEVTPAYALLEPATYAEMASLNDDCRFIFLMRDPIARLHSGIRHGLRKSEGRQAVTEERVLAELARQLAARDPAEPDRADYDRTIRRLEAAVDAGRVHYEFFEHLFRPDSVERLFGFLGLEARGSELPPRRNEGAAIGEAISPAFVQLASDRLRPVYDFVRARFGERVPATWTRLPGER